MAWILAGVGLAYAGTVVTDWWDSATKPMYDYIDKENTDAVEREREKLRQLQIERIRGKNMENGEIRDKYGIKKKEQIILVNNSEEVCDIIYANHYKSKNKEGAITWAKKMVDMKYTDGELLNKMSTKRVKLGVRGNLELIKNEFIEYYIVLHINKQFFVIDIDDCVDGKIMVKNKIKLKEENMVDLKCTISLF